MPQLGQLSQSGEYGAVGNLTNSQAKNLAGEKHDLLDSKTTDPRKKPPIQKYRGIIIFIYF